MLAHTLQTLSFKARDKTIAAAAVVEEEEEDAARPLGGAAARRRLRHVQQLALRGLDLGGGYILEVAAVGAAEPLERSDVFRTRNPTWAPVCGIRRGRQLPAFELRAMDTASHEVLWRQVVQLPELLPLGGSALEELHGVLPLASPLLQLGGQWFAQPEAASSSSSSSRAPVEPGLEPRRRPSRQKLIKASEICSAGERISAMLDRLRGLETRSHALREDMERSLARDCEFRSPRERRLLCEQRLGDLRRDAEARRQGVQRLRAQLAAERGRHEERAARQLRESARLREAQGEQGPVDCGGVEAPWRQLRCRQMRMLHEVCQVYPIENCGRYWTIRGFCIVGIDMLGRQDLREEENVSTALGFLVHLLVTLAGILEVPLRVEVQQAGCSRSYVRDPHESADRSATPSEWPLYYGRDLEKLRFETALRLLRDGLHQFLYSRGYFDERTCSGNLLECAELILRKEIYGSELP